MNEMSILDQTNCLCLTARQAARHITRFYDQTLAPTGLKAPQYSILAKLRRLGPIAIGALAVELIMDRTTLKRNLQPLEREGYVIATKNINNKRISQVELTEKGNKKLSESYPLWAYAQTKFHDLYGDKQNIQLLTLMRQASKTDLGISPTDAP